MADDFNRCWKNLQDVEQQQCISKTFVSSAMFLSEIGCQMSNLSGGDLFTYGWHSAPYPFTYHLTKAVIWSLHQETLNCSTAAKAILLPIMYMLRKNVPSYIKFSRHSLNALPRKRFPATGFFSARLKVSLGSVFDDYEYVGSSPCSTTPMEKAWGSRLHSVYQNSTEALFLCNAVEHKAVEELTRVGGALSAATGLNLPQTYTYCQIRCVV